MTRGLQAAVGVSLVCLALMGCDELLGIDDTVAAVGIGGANGDATAATEGAAAPGHENAGAGNGGAGLGAGGRGAAQAGAAQAGAAQAGTSQAGTAEAGEPGERGGAAGDADAPDHGGGGGSSGSGIVVAVAGEAGALAVTPSAFGSRLALWLAPEGPFVTNDAGVAEWHDLSPNAAVARQTDPEFTPALSSTALAGHPGVVFDGTGDYLSIPDTAALELGTSPFVLEIVFSHTTDPRDLNAEGGGLVFSKQRSDDYYTGIGVFVNRPISASYETTTRLAVQLDVFTALFTPPNVAYNDGQPRVLGMRRSTPDDFALRLNGKLVGNGVDLIDNPISADAPGAPLVLGSNFGPGQALRGVISEIVLVRDATDDDVTELEGYLLQKYGSVLAP